MGGFWLSQFTLTTIGISEAWVPVVVVTAKADLPPTPELRWRAIDLRGDPTQAGFGLVWTSLSDPDWHDPWETYYLGDSKDSVLPNGFVDGVNQRFDRSYPYGGTVRDFTRFVLRRRSVAGALRVSRRGTYMTHLDDDPDEFTAAEEAVEGDATVTAATITASTATPAVEAVEGGATVTAATITASTATPAVEVGVT